MCLEAQNSFLNLSSSTSSNSSGISTPKFSNSFHKNNSQKATRTTYSVIKQRKRKLLLLIGTVSLSFALLWLPIHVINLWKVFSESFPYTNLIYIIKLIAHTLSYLNSCLNPFLYVLMGGKFKTHFSFKLGNFKNPFTNNKMKQDFSSPKNCVIKRGSRKRKSDKVRTLSDRPLIDTNENL